MLSKVMKTVVFVPLVCFMLLVSPFIVTIVWALESDSWIDNWKHMWRWTAVEGWRNIWSKQEKG